MTNSEPNIPEIRCSTNEEWNKEWLKAIKNKSTVRIINSNGSIREYQNGKPIYLRDCHGNVEQREYDANGEILWLKDNKGIEYGTKREVEAKPKPEPKPETIEFHRYENESKEEYLARIFRDKVGKEKVVIHNCDFSKMTIPKEYYDWRNLIINEDCDFCNTTFEGHLLFNNSTINGDCYFIFATVNGNCCFNCTIINGECNFGGATINGDYCFNCITINEGCDFSDIKINGNCCFVFTTINHECNFSLAKIKGDCNIKQSQINMFNDFNQSKINGSLCFKNTTINGECYFDDATIKYGKYFCNAIINGVYYPVKTEHKTSL